MYGGFQFNQNLSSRLANIAKCSNIKDEIYSYNMSKKWEPSISSKIPQADWTWYKKSCSWKIQRLWLGIKIRPFRNTSWNYFQTIDYIMSAYRCGSFDKIREFIKLRERLSSSLHYSSVSVEKKLSDLALTTGLLTVTVDFSYFFSGHTLSAHAVFWPLLPCTVIKFIAMAWPPSPQTASVLNQWPLKIIIKNSLLLYFAQKLNNVEEKGFS